MRTLVRRENVTLPRPRAGAHDVVTGDVLVTEPTPASPPRSRLSAHVVAIGIAALAAATAGLTWAALSGPSAPGAVHQQTPPADNSDLNRLLDPSPVPGDPFPGRSVYDALVGTG